MIEQSGRDQRQVKRFGNVGNVRNEIDRATTFYESIDCVSFYLTAVQRGK